MRILLVEDEVDIAVLLQRLLTRENFIADIAETLTIATQAVQLTNYELVILDRRLPDGEGLDLVRFAQKEGIKSRFLILSALCDLHDKVEGLNLGADDYIVKPFEPDELVARARAVLRRPLPEDTQIWTCGKIVFDRKLRTVKINEKDCIFPRRELSIIEILIKAGRRVVIRESIEEAVYGYDDEIQSNTMESHISRLRKVFKQERAGVEIKAVRGVGYILKELD